ncbi:M48 family metallopeptidase [Defluviimonas salinarum]|nr:SprT family zinc-dependent metalloprotease [Defluviimonas salinarum]
MNTDVLEIAGIRVEVRRKRVKNLHVGVYPPDGSVRVAAPEALSADAIRSAVLTRMTWIRSKQQQFMRQSRQQERLYVSGETHFVFGRARRLSVTTQTGRGHRILLVGNDGIEFHVPELSSHDQRRRWMEAWYRAELRRVASPRIIHWSERIGCNPASWGIRTMKTKWGSCNPAKKIIWLNSELSKKLVSAIDYVILHEIAHFVSPRHDEVFLKVLETHMPTWRQVRADLNALPLPAWTEG